MSIQENLLKLKNQILDNVKLIAVSKTKPIQKIIELYNTGHRIFGENRVHELTEKFPQLPADIEWHFIGHLQTNKVKYIAPFVSLIHSVDSLKLLKEIDKEAVKNNRIVNCLLEMYIASEESKFGLDISEAFTILDSPDIKVMHNIRICGIMGMASFTEDMNLVRKEFRSLKTYFNQLKEKYFYTQSFFKEISMGMSGDYKIAIEEGSTMVRIGTAIFGEG
jgi:pyridoxal phosphate enzyme (YggS family)